MHHQPHLEVRLIEQPPGLASTLALICRPVHQAKEGRAQQRQPDAGWARQLRSPGSGVRPQGHGKAATAAPPYLHRSTQARSPMPTGCTDVTVALSYRSAAAPCRRSRTYLISART